MSRQAQTRMILSLIATLFVFTLVISCSTSDDNASKGSSLNAKTADGSNGQVVQFAAYDTDGNLRQSSEWIGKQPVVINFWGTWCPPCRHEIPGMVRIYNEYQAKGIEILGLAVNDTPEKVESFAQQQGMDWIMLMGSKEIADLYGQITSVPTTIFLDADGNEVARFVGARDYDAFKAAFDKLTAS